MYGYNVMNCHVIKLSHDKTDSYSTNSIVLKCNTCGKIGSSELEQLEEAGEVDKHLCDTCGEEVMNTLCEDE